MTTVEQREVAPHTQSSVRTALLINLTANEWNCAIRSYRLENPGEALCLSNLYLVGADLIGFDLEGVNLRGSDLRSANLSRSYLIDADLSCAEINDSLFIGADLRDAITEGWIGHRSADFTGAVGYSEPLPDITAQLARIALEEEVGNPQSEMNLGLERVRSSGVSYRWSGTTLKFWMTAEIERHMSACDEGECCCEIDHMCGGDCDCCACYRGECDCECEHSYEDIYPSEQFYLATFFGYLTYEWSDAYGKMKCHINASDGTCHPHVATSLTICWGDSEQPDSLMPEDHIMRVIGWIGQHNPTSEYRSITNLPLI